MNPSFTQMLLVAKSAELQAALTMLKSVGKIQMPPHPPTFNWEAYLRTL